MDRYLYHVHRSQTSGSVQTKFQLIADALTLAWMWTETTLITSMVSLGVDLLDNSPDGALNFDVTTATTSLVTASGASASVTVTELVEGVDYTTSCTGTQQVPVAQALVSGQYYYARVFAKNSVGYSLPQVAASSRSLR